MNRPSNDTTIFEGILYGGPRRLLMLLLAAVLTADSWVMFAKGLSSSSSFPSSSSSSPSSEPSPWASSSWLLTLDFGRPSSSSSSSSSSSRALGSSEDSTSSSSGFFSDASPFSSYGASGSRLVVTCPVVVEAEDDANNKKFPDAFVGTGASVIRARNENDRDEPDADRSNGNGNSNSNSRSDFTYITMEGAKTIEFSPGGWTLRFPPGGKSNKGRASKLRFYLDLTTDLSRNDVFLPAKTRLYFAASAWREADYEAGIAKVLPLKGALAVAQKTLDTNLSHSTGDRRLDGTDPLETIKAYGDMTALVLDRDRCQVALRAALDKGYPGSEDHPEGPWPGTTEWLTISEDNPIYARVPRTAPAGSTKNVWKQLFLGDGDSTDYDYGKVGTWTGEAINSLLLEDE